VVPPGKVLCRIYQSANGNVVSLRRIAGCAGCESGGLNPVAGGLSAVRSVPGAQAHTDCLGGASVLSVSRTTIEAGLLGCTTRPRICFNGQEQRQGHRASGWRLPYGKEVRFSLFGCVQNRKQDEIEMEAGGLGSEGPGTCLEMRGGALWCTRDPVRLQDTGFGFAGSCQCFHFYEIHRIKPRTNKNYRPN
jgi:hypothetical protein